MTPSRWRRGRNIWSTCRRSFELAGDKPEVAAAEAKTVLAIETGLAKASMDRTVRRDPKTRDHMMQVKEDRGARAQF